MLEKKFNDLTLKVEILEKELKKECNYASIRKIKYTDKEGDNIYVVDSAELESAIFKEGILKKSVISVFSANNLSMFLFYEAIQFST